MHPGQPDADAAADAGARPAAGGARLRRDRALADLLRLGAGVLLFFGLSVELELAERLNQWARGYEPWQLDELPLTLLVLSLGLLWFGARRWRELQAEMRERSRMEAQNHRLAQQLIALQESERRHIARELHDEFGQCCVAIKVDAALIARQCPDAAVQQGAQRIAESADHLHDVLRGMLTRLRPMGLDDLGLASSLELLVQGWQARHGIACSFSTEAPSEALQALDEAGTMTLYRSVQEGLTNIARHARASQASVHIARQPVDGGAVQLALTVRDNGVGPQPAVAQHGLGLLGMRERVGALGGQLTLSRLLGGGTELRVLLPLPAVAAAAGVSA